MPNSIMHHLTRHLYEAKLVYYSDTFENRVRTFGMNPGGVVSEEHYTDGIAVVNGHSYGDQSRKTENNLILRCWFPPALPLPLTTLLYTGNTLPSWASTLTGGPIMVQRLGDSLSGLAQPTRPDRVSPTTRPTLTTAVPGDLSFCTARARHLPPA